MNIFQLALKQMRQRALSSWLTMLSVLLGVALAVSIMIVLRGSDQLFGQSDFGFDVIIGKRSPTQLTLNTVYHLDASPGIIPWSLYEQVSGPQYRSTVRVAVPTLVGDNYAGFRIVGTLPKMFGFDDKGEPLTGYDAKGVRLKGYEDPDLDEDQRDPKLPVAAAVMEYRQRRKYTLAEGSMFKGNRFEAVIGSEVAHKTGLKLGSEFQATHGLPGGSGKPDIHAEKWKVVGILDKTFTANDRIVFIPLFSAYTIEEHDLGAINRIRAGEDVTKVASGTTQTSGLGHDGKQESDKLAGAGGSSGAPNKNLPDQTPAAGAEKGHEEDHDEDDADHDDHNAEAGEHHHHEHHKNYSLDDAGNIVLSVPKDQWMISAIVVRSRGPVQSLQLVNAINNRDDATAVNPASSMREFLGAFVKPSGMLLQGVSYLVSVVAAISILVSIYNSVAARKREIAILRALGATRVTVLLLICLEAALIGLIGGVLGLVAGHLLGAAGSMFMERLVGQGINWLAPGLWEWVYLAGVVVLAILAGLVPARLAYRTSVASNLVSG